MIVVADTSPPLHLGRIGRLDLLPIVVGRVTIPRTVWNELVHPETRADVSAALRSADWTGSTWSMIQRPRISV